MSPNTIKIEHINAPINMPESWSVDESANAKIIRAAATISGIPTNKQVTVLSFITSKFNSMSVGL